MSSKKITPKSQSNKRSDYRIHGGTLTPTQKRLRTVDTTLRGAFFTLAISVFALSILTGGLALLNSQNPEFARAQQGENTVNPNDPNAPSTGGIDLPQPSPSPSPTATIASINRQNNQLVVNFTTQNFTNSQTGNHTNFYFNTELVTATNNSFYGASPFTISTTSIPTGATELCVVVADGQNNIISNSGNCLAIPAASTNPTTPAENGGDTPTTDPADNGGSTEDPTSPTPANPSTPPQNNGGTGTQNPTSPTTPTYQTPNYQQNPSSDPLTAGQQSGSTARSGGLAFAAGFVIVAVAGYYAYYYYKGDRKAILKTAEQKINVKK